MDGDAVRQELGAELRRLALAEVQGREAQVHAAAAGTVGAADAVVALLRPEPDGVHALDMLEQKQYDLVVTDLMMPEMDGYELSKQIKKHTQIPIIMVTAKEELVDKKMGFSVGADDYMVKPIEFEELLLRISALLKRYKLASERVIEIGDTIVDYNSMTVTVKNVKTVELTKKEFQLLFKLLSSSGRIFTRSQLMDDIWGYESESEERTVDVHIRRIREKLDFVTDFELVTIRGLGYKAVRKDQKQ